MLSTVEARTGSARKYSVQARARATSDISPVSVWLVAPVICTSTSSPGSPTPTKLTTLLWRERPRRREGSVREGPSIRTSSVAADEPLGALVRAALDHLDEPLHALDAHLVRDLVGERAASVPRRGE